MRTPERRGIRFVSLLFALVLTAAATTFGNSNPTTTSDIDRFLNSVQACDGDLCRFAAIQKALKADASNEQANLALADYYTRREQLRPAREILSKLLQQSPGNRAALLRLTKIDVREGYRDEALRCLRSLGKTAVPGEFSELALAYESLGLLPQAVDFGRRAIATAPNDTVTQALLMRLAERLRDADLYRHLKVTAAPVPSKKDTTLEAIWRGDEQAVDQDKPFLADVSALASQKVDSSDAFMLADIRIDRVQQNGLAAKHIQQITYLGSEAAANDYAVRRIQYEPALEELSIVHARLYKHDGRVIEAADEGDQFVADLGSAMYYDSRSRLLRFRGTEPGDIVELEYRTRPVGENPYGNYFATLQTLRTSVTTRLRRYVLVSTTDRQFYITAEKAPEPRVSASGDTTTRIWELQNIAALPNEPLAPPITERSPYIHVSTLKDAEEMGLWYSKMLEPQLELPPDLKQVADEIRDTTPDAMDRVSAIYHFVLGHSRYLAFEFGIHSYKPYKLSQIYTRRFGDCKDDASLIVAMLREVGIDAEFALVRTRTLGKVNPEAVSLSLFNHAMVYVPRFDLWLDGTAQYFGIRELPLEDQGAMALTVAKDGTAHRRTITVTRPEDNLTRRSILAEIKPDGAIAFEGEQRNRGESVPTLRRDYERTEQQRDAMQRALAAVMPNVRLDDMRVQPVGKNDPEIDVSFQGVLESSARATSPKGKSLSLRTTWLNRDYRQKLASGDTRTQDLILGAPWKSEENFTFTLPSGARVVSTPTPVNIDGPFGNALLTYTVEGNKLHINTAVEFRATRVQPEEYSAFRQFCAELDRAFRRDVKVQLP